MGIPPLTSLTLSASFLKSAGLFRSRNVGGEMAAVPFFDTAYLCDLANIFAAWQVTTCTCFSPLSPLEVKRLNAGQ